MGEPIERDYLATLRSVVTMDVWRSIVQKAAEDAQDGNPQARAWVTRIVLGAQPMSLTALAVRESLGVSPFGKVEAFAWGVVNEDYGSDENADALGLAGMSIVTAQKETAKAERRARRRAKQFTVIEQAAAQIGEGAQPLALPAPAAPTPNGSGGSAESGEKAPGRPRK